jgi:hypothetical protein
MHGHKEVHQTGVAGKVFRWFFFGFNILMGLWLLNYWSRLSNMPAISEAFTTGIQAGGFIGTFLLMIFWAVGAGILAALMWATRGPAVYVPISGDEAPRRLWLRTALILVTMISAAVVLTLLRN